MKTRSSLGGRVSQASGKGHRFNSETARKAALKAWKTRWRFLKRSGTRIGRPAKYRPRVKRAPLREYYALHPTDEIAYLPHIGKWIRRDDQGIRVVGERVALRHLGHLPKEFGRRVPKEVITVVTQGKKGKGQMP